MKVGGAKSKTQCSEVSKSPRSPTSQTPGSKIVSESSDKSQEVRSPVTTKSEGRTALSQVPATAKSAESGVKTELSAEASRSGHTTMKKEHLKQLKIELSKKGSQPHLSAAATLATPPVGGVSAVTKHRVKGGAEGGSHQKESEFVCKCVVCCGLKSGCLPH